MTGRGSGSWPPFEAGNGKSVIHGARSPRKVGPLADEIAAELLKADSTPDHLRRPEFAAAVRAWSRAEAVVACVWGWLSEQGIEVALTDITSTAETEEHSKTRTTRRGTSRRVTSVLEQLRRYEAHAAALRRSLGLDPLGAGRLAKDLSASRWYQASSPLDRKLAEIEENRRAIGGGHDGE